MLDVIFWLRNKKNCYLTFTFHWSKYAGSDAVDRTLTPSTENHKKYFFNQESFEIEAESVAIQMHL